VRKIIHIDMDAFFASVEQRDNPELLGKPIAVGRSAERGVVAAASYEARRFGVRSAMPSVTAKRKCPDLIFVPHRMEVYKKVSGQIRRIFLSVTDLVEPLSLDEAYLDVTNNKLNLPSATEIARIIKQRIREETGLTASAGVSINKFLAKIASDMNKPDGLYVIRPEQAQAFIDELPIERFFGIGKVTASKMRALGITNGASLKTWSLNDLVSRFGKAGHYFYEVAHGMDNRPVVSHRERKSIGAERTFASDLTTLAEMQQRLSEIASEVERRMQQQSRMARTVTLKVKFADFRQITRSHTLSEATANGQEIHGIASNLMSASFQDGMRVRLLGITMSGLVTPNLDVPQLSLQI
jgi:DNA polymerase-4